MRPSSRWPARPATTYVCLCVCVCVTYGHFHLLSYTHTHTHTQTKQGKLTDAFWSRVSLTRYQSSKTSLTYADFVARGGFGAAAAAAAVAADAGTGTETDAGKGKGKGKHGQKRRIEVK